MAAEAAVGVSGWEGEPRLGARPSPRGRREAKRGSNGRAEVLIAAPLVHTGRGGGARRAAAAGAVPG